MPVSGFKTVTLNGEKVKLFYIRKLADSLGRTSQTIVKWEIAGVIPKTPFRDSSRRRMYTQEQIDIIVATAEKCKITQGASISNTSFSSRVHKALNELHLKYTSKQ